MAALQKDADGFVKGASILLRFFGLREGQTKAQFVTEVKDLKAIGQEGFNRFVEEVATAE